jgi:hypothetical protein
MKLHEARTKLNKMLGAKEETEKNVALANHKLKELKKDLRYHIQAREIIQQVGMKTQQQLQFHIGEITSMALKSIFKEPYQLDVNFVKRRNKTECDLLFVREGNAIEPKEASGVGAIDVAGFALRIASWSMENPRSNNVILLDEPFKHLKGYEENLKVIAMVKQLSEKLNLQIIMVHDERVPLEDIEKGADKVFEAKMRKGITTVKEK